MYTHTKGRKAPWISQAICVYIWLQPRATCLVCLHNLVWERDVLHVGESECHKRLHFFLQIISKSRNLSENSKQKCSCEEICSNALSRNRFFLRLLIIVIHIYINKKTQICNVLSFQDTFEASLILQYKTA